MLKKIFFVALLVFAFAGCELEDITIPFNFEKDAPVWLKIKKEKMQVNQDYYGMKVFRYEWHEKFIYHFMIPVSSCAYCELYDENGYLVNFTNEEFQDFLSNKKNEVLVWEWKL